MADANKNNTNDPNIQRQLNGSIDDSIKVYTMPKRMVVQQTGNPQTKIIVLGIIVVLVLIGIGGTIFFLNQRLQPAPQVVVRPDPVVEPVLEPDTDTKTEEPVIDIEEPEPEPTPEPPQPIFIRQYLPSKDTDEDGITDIEEQVYGTSISRADSDGDGHIDTNEILNLYNPRGAAPANLIDSGFISSYENPKFEYIVFYPRDWVIFTTDVTGRIVEFRSPTQERIRIKIEDNPEKLSIVDWYIQKYPELDPLDVRTFTTANNLRGVKTPNGVIAHMLREIPTHIGEAAEAKTIVYTVEYDPGDLSRINFLTTFEMMLRSFVVVSEIESSAAIEDLLRPGIGVEGQFPEGGERNNQTTDEITDDALNTDAAL